MKNLLLILALTGIIASCDQPANGKDKTGQNKNVADLEEIKPDTTGTIKRLPEPMPTGGPNLNKPSVNDERSKAIEMFKNGVELYNQGKLDEALTEIKTSVQVFQENSLAYHYLGRIYFEKGQKGLSLSYYQDAVKYDANDSTSTLAIGQVYFDMGDSERAMEYYNKAVEMAPNFALAYYNRGTLLGMQKHYNSSLQDLNKSIAIDPSNGNSFVNRGLAYFYLKDMEKACESWKQAAKMGMPKGMEAVELYCE